MEELYEQTGQNSIVTGKELALGDMSGSQLPLSSVQAKEVATVLGKIKVAQTFPRSVATAASNIAEECKRKSLAHSAEYAYQKGKTLITGPSIRLMEVIARNWHNLNWGLEVIETSKQQSKVEVFAWDMETNTQVTRTIIVKHWRDLKNGKGYWVTGEREVRELVNNIGARGMRKCLEELIPGDIVAEARQQCAKTLRGDSDKPLIDRIKAFVEWFKKRGVSSLQIEDMLNCKIDQLTEDMLVKLNAVANAIKEKPEAVANFFSPPQKKLPESKKKEEPKPKAKDKKPDEPAAKTPQNPPGNIDINLSEKETL